MTLLNVSFGIFAFMPQGWIFMAAIVLIESVGISFFLTKKWINLEIFIVIFLSNLISGIAGIIISMLITGGWWLVIWLPWVSSYEVDSENGLNWLILYYCLAFLLTIVIEILYNAFKLKSDYERKDILKFTLLANIVTYLLGSIAMYSYSFS